MGRLTQADAVEFAAIKSLCYADLDSATLRERVGERLRRYLGAASYCFGACDPATGLPVQSISVGLSSDTMAAFHQLVLATPAADFGRWAARHRRVAVLEELVEDYDGDPYVAAVMRASDLRYEAQVSCIGAGRTWGHLCIRRRGEAGPFEAHELRLLAAVAPHLTAGLRAAAARAALSSSPGTQTGVVLLGADGHVQLANGVARRLLEEPSSGDGHRVLSAVHVVAAMLERTLNEPFPEPLPALTLTDEAAGEVYVLRGERITGADGRQLGLVLFEPAAPPRSAESLAWLQQLGLTPREAEVTAAVLRGCSTAAIAEELVVSPHTVHDHLRRVYEKLGVTSRQQLATRLLGAA